jgi:hypothetical protein
VRLSVLEHGRRRRAKLFIALTGAMSRADGPDIVGMLLYRPGSPAGHTEDQVFEVTVAAAGAALHDFDAGRRALAEGPGR